MNVRHARSMSILAAMCMAWLPLAVAAADGTSVVPKSELKWKSLGNGIAAAQVSGDMDKGPSRFYLKYPVGLVTPNHHHDAARQYDVDYGFQSCDRCHQLFVYAERR